MVSLNPNVEAASILSLHPLSLGGWLWSVTSYVPHWSEHDEGALVCRLSTYPMTKPDCFGEALVSIPLRLLSCFLSLGSQLMSIISFATCWKGDSNSDDYALCDSSVLPADGVCSPATYWLFWKQDEDKLW